MSHLAKYNCATVIGRSADSERVKREYLFLKSLQILRTCEIPIIAKETKTCHFGGSSSVSGRRFF